MKPCTIVSLLTIVSVCLLILRVPHTNAASESDFQRVCFPENCYFISKHKKSFKQAKHACASINARLVEIRNSAQNTLVWNMANRLSLKPYFIDGSDSKKEGTFVNSYNKKKLVYKNWLQHEPNNLNNEDCIHVGHRSNSKWNDTKCKLANYFVCEMKMYRKCLGKKCYLMSSYKANFNTAKRQCRRHFGVIALIKNASINKFVWKLAKSNKIPSYYIDGTDRYSEGTFQDRNLKKLKYTNWLPKEPNNLHNEDCIQVGHKKNEKWNDVSCNRSFNFACKQMFTKKCFGSTCYLFSTYKKNFLAARRECKRFGAHLVEIKNLYQNRKIYRTGRKLGVTPLYIEGTDSKKEGKWVNRFHKQLSFTHWHANEPNNLGNEDCIQLGRYSTTSKWNDIKCSTKMHFVCKL